MTVSIGQNPDSGFDEPLQLLSDCHRRIEKFLDILIRVVKDCPGQKLSAEYRTALTAALKYFQPEFRGSAISLVQNCFNISGH